METLFNSWWFIIIFWGIGAFSSYLFARYAWDIHGGERPTGALLFQQYFLNFIGSFFGWVMLWIVLPNLITSIGHHSSTTFSAKDVFILIIAIIGITGYLPVALVRLAMNIKDIIPKTK